MPVRDPRTYLEFADERSRPFVDLLSESGPSDLKVVVDSRMRPRPAHRLGWDDRQAQSADSGVSTSPEMITQAAKFAWPANEVSAQPDLRDWRPDVAS